MMAIACECNCGPKPSFTQSCSKRRLLPIECAVMHYSWGKLGSASHVARMAEVLHFPVVPHYLARHVYDLVPPYLNSPNPIPSHPSPSRHTPPQPVLFPPYTAPYCMPYPPHSIPSTSPCALHSLFSVSLIACSMAQPPCACMSQPSGPGQNHSSTSTPPKRCFRAPEYRRSSRTQRCGSAPWRTPARLA